jgi:hypothetical protein
MERTMGKAAKSKADVRAEVQRRATAGEPKATYTSVRRAFGLTREEYAKLPEGGKPKSAAPAQAQAHKPKAARKPARTGSKAHPFAGTVNGNGAKEQAQARADATGRVAWYQVGNNRIQVSPLPEGHPRKRS